ncbi:NucA/NucB deoxyribonuclease domain-containing protein [Streptomyces sp. NPDC001312]|uniref:NucA/NucB deoxyribonuclease domain-containing protein n=1 Tax=Streptomyces sp. NPDC001312 TaxID=3364561 RepID=UPI0036B6E376
MRHINLAQTHPELTDPKVSGKLIPGSIASGKTLSRLYDKWDTAAGEQKNRNTAAMDRACATIKPSNTDGLDCDEYPFASTWEGAGSGPNFSVKYLDSTQNRSAGSQLGDWYTKDGILHKDSFYVAIDK